MYRAVPAVPCPIIVPAPIVTEVAYFFLIEPGPAVETTFLDALARSELTVEATTAQDFAWMADLVRQYADFLLGTADASVIAVAERLGTTHVATIDHRRFRQCVPRTALPSSYCLGSTSSAPLTMLTNRRPPPSRSSAAAEAVRRDQ